VVHGDLPGNQTDGFANTVSRLCVPATNTDRLALYKEPPQRDGGAGNAA